jgi:hypothetical protein
VTAAHTLNALRFLRGTTKRADAEEFYTRFNGALMCACGVTRITGVRRPFPTYPLPPFDLQRSTTDGALQKGHQRHAFQPSDLALYPGVADHPWRDRNNVRRPLTMAPYSSLIIPGGIATPADLLPVQPGADLA